MPSIGHRLRALATIAKAPGPFVQRTANDIRTLRRTFWLVAEQAPPWYEQIVNYATQKVLQSDEIQNAMSYANIKSEDLLAQTIEHSSDIMMLDDSSMSGFKIQRRADYEALKTNLVNTLTAHRASRVPDSVEQDSQKAQNPLLIGSNGLITFLISLVNKDIAAAFGELSPQIAISIVVLMSTYIVTFIAITMISGIMVGIALVLFLDMVVVLATLFFVNLIPLSFDTWALSEHDADAMARTVIAPFLRRQVNAKMRRAHLEDSFHVTTAPALTDLSDRDQLVDTTTMRRLRTLIRSMTYGSLGISGARGTGKSVLLRSFCDEKFEQPEVPELGILVSAPVDYDGREFILYLFGTLCAKVIDFSGTTEMRSSLHRIINGLTQLGVIAGGCLIATEAGVRLSRAEIEFGERTTLGLLVASIILLLIVRLTGLNLAAFLERRKDQNALLANRKIKNRRVALFTAAAGIVTAFIIEGSILNSKFYVPPAKLIQPTTWERRFWAGATVVVAAALIGLANSIMARRKRRPRTITEQAHEHLRRIESLRTITTGRSAAVSINGRIQIGRNSARQVAEKDLTLPKIVDLYREFSTEVVAWWREYHGGAGRMVIGIDELDKIVDSETAERFINEIKMVFGIPGCLYLVSMSEDALLEFEQKSLGFRSTFDSAFDDMIRVDTISLEDTREMLSRRIAGIGDPFILLCYIFSGGLPRDVLRMARTLVEARTGGLATLGDILEFLISREIVDVKRGFLAARRLRDAPVDVTPIIGSLLDDRWPGRDSDALLASATPTLRGQSRGLYAALYFLGTAAELIVKSSIDSAASLYFVSGVSQDGINDMATARGLVSTDPDVAVELVRASRAKLGLGSID